MDELPGEMVVAVLGWVEAPDLVACHLVCRRWRHLLSAHLSAGGRSGLWRRCYLRTWPPPLSSAVAHHPGIATAAQPIDWRALCLQRIGLLRHSDQQARMAEVAALLRSAATLAAPDLLGAKPEEAPEELTHGTTGAPAEKKKKTKRKAKAGDNDDKPKKRKKRSTRKRTEGKDSKEEKKKKKEKKKRKRTSSSSSGSASSEEEKDRKVKKVKKDKKKKRTSSSSSGSAPSEEEEDRKVKKVKKDKKKAKKKRRVEEKTEDSAQAELQAAHQRHIADVQGPVEKAQQVLAYLNRVAGLRQRAHQLLHSYQLQGKASADEKVSKEHLLTMLFRGNMLYAKIHHKEIDLGDVMDRVKYKASMVVYSLVTGLPLLMTYSFSYNQAESSDQLSWKSLAAGADPLEGLVGELFCPAAKERADYAALQAFLFGRENADTVDPPTLEKFVEGVFVPPDDYYVKCWLQWPRP